MKTNSVISAAGTASSPELIKVMIVDDSAVVRGLISRILESDPMIRVDASVGNGQVALSILERQDIDVVVLDVEMPVMDGMTALPMMLKIDPSVQIIIASTVTLKNAEISIHALEAGAAEFIPKPSSTRELTSQPEFRELLLAKVNALGARRREDLRREERQRALKENPVRGFRPSNRPEEAKTKKTSVSIHSSSKIVLRSASPEKPEVLAIGSSTGGPQALFALLSNLSFERVRVPVLITQHMPPTFTTILAEHIRRVSGWEAAEAKDGEPVKGGRVYIAPGDYHMIVENRRLEKILHLVQTPPENFCRPAVDPMLRSVAKVWGKGVLACILTGMGYDGLKGCQAVVSAGGTVIAQDEATSVVWGMPGAVATSGLCSAVLPLPDIAPYVYNHMMKRS